MLKLPKNRLNFVTSKTQNTSFMMVFKPDMVASQQQVAVANNSTLTFCNINLPPLPQMLSSCTHVALLDTSCGANPMNLSQENEFFIRHGVLTRARAPCSKSDQPKFMATITLFFLKRDKCIPETISLRLS